EERVDARFVRLFQGFNTSLCLTEITPPDRFPQVFYRANPADLQLKIGDEELRYIRQAKNFVTNGTALAASPSRESAVAALKAAHAGSARTIFDVDYRASSWPSPAAAGAAARDILSLLKVVLANAAAAVVVSRVSCSDAMPTLDELATHLPPRFRPAQLARAVDTRRGN